MPSRARPFPYGFMAIGANVIAESDLEKLHEVMPYGVFIDVNPAPNLLATCRFLAGVCVAA